MTDNGSAYRSHAFRGRLAQLGIRHIRTRPYTPKTNGKAELLGVEVQQFARPLALVAHHRRRRVERSETAEPQPAQHRAHGRARQAELAGDPIAAQALPAQPLDLAVSFAGSASAVSAGRRALILKRDLAARPIPRQPMVRAAHRQAGCRGRLGNLPALCLDPQNHQEATLRCQPSILVDVHPGLRQKVGWCRNPNLTPQTRMNNLNSFHS